MKIQKMRVPEITLGAVTFRCPGSHRLLIQVVRFCGVATVRLLVVHWSSRQCCTHLHLWRWLRLRARQRRSRPQTALSLTQIHAGGARTHRRGGVVAHVRTGVAGRARVTCGHTDMLACEQMYSG